MWYKVKKIYVGANLVRPKWKPWSNTVAYYPLTENANDYSWNWYNATNIWATFSSDWAYFWTYDKRISLPTMTIWQIATINLWVKTPDWLTWVKDFSLYFDRSSSYRNILFWLATSWVVWNTWNNSTTQHNFIISEKFWTGWTNMVLVKTWTTVTIYQNWTQIWTDSGWYNVTLPWWRNTVTIWHNTLMTSDTQAAVWYLKDYIIENRVWTSTEVSNYYNQTKSNYWL